MDFRGTDSGGVECIEPALEACLVHHREHIRVPRRTSDRSQPAHLAGVRLTHGLVLERIGKHRPGVSPGRIRQARASDQYLRGGNHQLDARGAARQLRKRSFSGNRFAAIVDERPLTPHRCVGKRTPDAQQAHGYLRQTIAGQPAFSRASSADPRACASPMVIRVVAMK